MFSKKEIIVFIFVGFIGLSLAYSCRLQAGDWNEKPVMCAGKKETFETLKDKNEVMLFSGLTYAKVRSETGYDVIPAKLPFWFYVNFKTGTYTIVEYHPDYSTYCVVAYGVNLQSFVGGIE